MQYKLSNWDPVSWNIYIIWNSTLHYMEHFLVFFFSVLNKGCLIIDWKLMRFTLPDTEII